MASLSITFTGTAQNLQVMTAALAQSYGYQATINSAPNPETSLAFVQRVIKQQIIDTAKGVIRIAAEQAADAGVADMAIT